MRTRRGCGCFLFGALFVVVAGLVFAALAWAMVLVGEIPLYPPRLTDLQPGPSDPFRPTTPITLTFDQPMDPASTEAAFALIPPVYGAFRWNEDHTQMTFVPEESGYAPGTSYSAYLGPDALAGTIRRPLVNPLRWRFSLPPLLASQTPPSGAEGLGAWPRLQAAFNYALDCAAVAPTFSIVPPAQGVLECLGHTLTFSPTQPLSPDAAYAAAVGQVYLAGDPTARPGVTWEFRTASPLTVVDVAPVSPVTDLWTPVRITFNRPVVADSVVSRFALIAQDGQTVPGQATWEGATDEGGAVFVFSPTEPLIPDTRYRLTLAAGVRDELGFTLADPLVHLVETAPLVEAVLPPPGTQDVRLDSALHLAFTRPMDRASVEAGLTITPALKGEMTWEGDTLVFAPRGGLAPETTYRAALSADVRDASGAPLAVPLRWSFSTQPFLLAARPDPGAFLLALQQPLGFVFALPMDRASVEAALTISPTTPGRFEWSGAADGEGNWTVAFYPDPAWLSGADYGVTLAAAARTADGYQTLGEDYELTFSTGVAEVQFGQGPNAQVMDAEGERAFQFISRGADVADFRLYPITPTQFLALYSSGFRGIGPGEAQIVDTTGLTPTVAWREATTPSEEAYDDWRIAEAHIPADAPPGLYVLAAEPAAEEYGQLLVVLTGHTLALKRALAGQGARTQAQIVAWDTEFGGGGPVVSATVRLYDRAGTFLAEGLTDADGLLTLDVPGDPAPLLALADRDGDLTVCGLGNEWGQGGWWGWWRQPPSRPLYTTYSYTDRPIYRPGQTIYFKDWIRADADVSYTLPVSPSVGGETEGPPITVRLRDARDNVAAAQVLTPTRFGTVYGEFHLADEPMLGLWRLETEVAGSVTRQPLKVEEYRKPEYEVAVHTAQTAYVQGEAISLTVEAAYYFGQPAAGAQVELVVYTVEPDWYGEEEPRFGYPFLTRKGRTDDQGRWTVIVPTDDALPSLSYNRGRASVVLALEATVTDEAGQGVSSYQTVVVHRAAQGVTLLLEKHGYRPGEEIAFSALARDLDGEPAASVELSARVLGWDDREAAAATGATDAAGQAHFSVQLGEQGWYRLRVSGADAAGREVETEEYLWVYDPTGQAPWYQGRWEEEAALSIRADRSTYAVGDVAQLMVYAPTPGPALLTFERGETHGAQPVTLASGANLITVPIRADYAPNIHVTVNQYRPVLGTADAPQNGAWWSRQSRPEARLYTASAQLLAPMTDRLLTVTLTADQETYEPGEEAAFRVQVTDQEGRPVVAEVSLALVDEAIYALAEDLSRDPFEVFYSPRPNIVRTFDSLRPTRWLFPQGGRGGGGDGGGGAPRRAFLDTAYWAPAVVTDEAGEATVTLTLPDNLTEWRALARAVTTDTLVGQATTRIVVSQEIVVRPALPRFLVQGDVLTLTAVVHNFTSQAVSATAELTLSNLQPLASNLQAVASVPAGGSATVGWPVTAPTAGEARVTVRVRANRGARLVGRDAVESPLPVLPLVVPEVAAFSSAAGDLTPERPTATLTITLPADAIEGLSRLEVNLAPSVAPGLLDGIEYLIDYPFG